MKKIVLFILVLFIVLGIIYIYKQKKIKSGSSPYTINYAAPTPAENTEPTKLNEGLNLTIFSPKEEVVKVNSSSFLIEGQTKPQAEIFVADRELKADDQGKFSTTLDLDEGENIIVITANDQSGNFAEQTLTITLESSQ